MAKKPAARRKITVDKSKPGGKTAGGRAKAENKARSKTGKDLTEAQEIFAVAQVKVKQERRARIRVEKAPANAQEALALPKEQVEQRSHARVTAKNTRAEAESVLRATNLDSVNESIRTRLAAPGKSQPQSRDFFVVRLEFDRPSQSGWMEIEHGPSRTKRKFRDLDGEGLVAFIKECISPATIPEHALLEMPPAAQDAAPMPEPRRETFSLIVSDVRIARLATPNVASLILNSNEAFWVQIRFQLQGPDASSVVAQRPPYEMKVYAYSVISSAPQLLTTYNAVLAREVLDYVTQIQVPRLSPGLYRLFTLATLRAPVKMAGSYDGPIIHVI